MLDRANLAVLHFINGGPWRGRAFDVLVTELDQNAILRWLVLAIPYVYFWTKRPLTRDRARLLGAIIGAAASVLVCRGLAHLLPFSMRPMFDPSSGFQPLSLPFSADMENWSAFPSDTAALCFALPLGICAVAPFASLLLCGASTVMFILPRIYSGLHYPVDVVAGAAIGAVSVAIGIAFGTTDRCRIFCKSAMNNYPGLFYSAAFLALVETTQMFDGLRNLVRAVRQAFLPLH